MILKPSFINFLEKAHVNNKSETDKSRFRRVLGIDPGLASTGWGIVDYKSSRFTLVNYGTITSSQAESHENRLLTIYTAVQNLLREYSPSEFSIEALFFARNVTSALKVAEARGVIYLCIAQHNFTLSEYTPNTIKQSVTGTASADKELVQKYVKLLLGMDKIPKPNHAADALAAAITHCHHI